VVVAGIVEVVMTVVMTKCSLRRVIERTDGGIVSQRALSTGPGQERGAGPAPEGDLTRIGSSLRRDSHWHAVCTDGRQLGLASCATRSKLELDES
jgi:hypothetical protein